MLLPIEQSLFLKEVGCKKHVVWSFGSSGRKIVFTLLDKVITLHVDLTAVQLWKPSLQGSLVRTVWKTKWLGSKSRKPSLQNGFMDPLEVCLWVSDHWINGGRNKSRSSRQSRSGSTRPSRSRGINVITLSGSKTSGLIFANWRRVLTRATASRRSGHCVGWIESFNQSSKR